MAGSFNLDDYVQVNERIELFYKAYPQGSIQTEIISNQDGQIIIKAYVYRDREDPRPCTGHAMEKEGSSYINKTSHIENCETSAVGRALAMMGFEIKKSVASKEEVANARLNQQPKPKPNKKPQPEQDLEVTLGDYDRAKPIQPPTADKDTKRWSRFWAKVRNLGYTPEQVHEKFGSLTGKPDEELAAILKQLEQQKQMGAK